MVRSTVGRPRASSAATLAEAASELSLELGYPAVTVDEIARRAGVSRSTFFAYFAGKADVLWADLDLAIARAVAALSEAGSRAAISTALTEAVAAWGEEVPWALRDAATIDATADLTASAPSRIATLQAAVAHRLAVIDQCDPQESLVAARSAALVGAAVGAIGAWASCGRDRGTASHAVGEALELVR